MCQTNVTDLQELMLMPELVKKRPRRSKLDGRAEVQGSVIPRREGKGMTGARIGRIDESSVKVDARIGWRLRFTRPRHCCTWGTQPLLDGGPPPIKEWLAMAGSRTVARWRPIQESCPAAADQFQTFRGQRGANQKRSHLSKGEAWTGLFLTIDNACLN
jgi:hypothetical protein